MVDFPIEKKQLYGLLELVEKNSVDAVFDFVVAKEDEFRDAQELITGFNIENFSFQPFYTGRNLQFFRKYVFLKKRAVLEAKPTADEILIRAIINPINFGRISILPDGSVYANVNADKLGRLGKDSLYKMLCKEMEKGSSWRRTRKKVKPCKDCLYELLCPPLSNYEYAIGRNNLCHIWSAGMHSAQNGKQEK
ncbi:hypothetical protein ACFLRB_03000 [Acidobacteriota bacterium]